MECFEEQCSMDGSHAPDWIAMMSIHFRGAVRSILGTMLITCSCSVALCGAFAILLYNAWGALAKGIALAELADANRVISQEMQKIRDRSFDALLALQNSKDAKGVVLTLMLAPSRS
jgi:hypothetical protein